MDKLLLSLYFTMLLATLTVNSAPMPSSKIMSTIEQHQQQQQQQMRPKKYGHVINNDNNNNNNSNNDNDDSIIKTENAESDSRMQNANKNADRMEEYMGEDVDAVDDDGGDERRPSSLFDRRDEIIGEMRQHRQNKMFGYFSFNPYAAYTIPQYTQPLYYPPEFFDDFSSFYGYNSEEEEIMSRQNPGNRRRPGSGNFKNSPIYYIRLPPTPYMFVPGLGYISQPPTYTPMAPPIPQAISPFYNLPIDFISNGKPTNIYQWGSPAAQFSQQQQFAQQPQLPQFTAQPQYQPQPQFAPQSQFVPSVQTPAYQPSYQRPQRPYQRPMNPYIQESKVTNLKGAFLFNGRPEEIYVLPPSSYNSIYPDPRFVSPYY